MAHDETDRTDRRKFLQAGALATASAVSLTPGLAGQELVAKTPCFPSGSWARPVSRSRCSRPVRSGATNACSGSHMPTASGSSTPPRCMAPRRNFKKWFEQDPKIRKEIVVVTKDMPRTPKEMLTNGRRSGWRRWGPTTSTSSSSTAWATGGTVDESINMVTSQEFKETADAIRKSGKARFIGFSTHNKDRAPIIQAAAEAGFIDAIMLQYRPWLDKDSPLNKALDVCWKNGIGLISMKQIAGNAFGDKPKGDILEGSRAKGADAGRAKTDPVPGTAARDLDR